MSSQPKPVEFHIVRARSPDLRRKPRLRTVVGAALVAALLAIGAVAAGSLSVTQKADTSSVFAERFAISEQFVVDASNVWVAKEAHAALGVQGSGIEMGASLPAARTVLRPDEWVYTVVVKEAGLATALGGDFTIELFVDEESAGRIFVAQAEPNHTVVEGVTASFAIGPGLSTSALYYVVVKPFVQVGPTIAFGVKSTPAGDLTWTGVGGTVEGVVNPGLTLTLGSTLRLTAANGDGILHNVGIKDASGTLMSPPGWSPDFESLGQQQTVSWTPTAAGTYTYLCKYHAATMKGTITVSA